MRPARSGARAGIARAARRRAQPCRLPLWLTCCDDHAAVSFGASSAGPGRLARAPGRDRAGSAAHGGRCADRVARPDSTRHTVQSFQRSADLIPATVFRLRKHRREACARAPPRAHCGRGSHAGTCHLRRARARPPARGLCEPRAHSTHAHSLAQRLEASTPAAASEPGDEPFEGQASLERAALIAGGARRNPGLAAARSAWRAALARYPQETALEDPMLDGAIGPDSFGSDAVDPGFRIGLIAGAAVPRQARAARRAGARRGRGELAGVRGRATAARAAASLLFDEYYLAARASEQNARHLALVEELSQAALARYESGERVAAGCAARGGRAAELLHRKIELETSQRRAAERINTLLHRSPELPLPPPPAALAVPTDATLDAAALTQRALDGASGAARGARAGRGARARGRARAPRVLPRFHVVGRLRPLLAGEAAAARARARAERAAPARAPQRRARRGAGGARTARAARRSATRIEVRLDVARAVDRLREAHHLVELARDRMLPVSRDRLAASRAAFESGQGSFLELIDAERGLRRAELDYEGAVVDALASPRRARPRHRRHRRPHVRSPTMSSSSRSALRLAAACAAAALLAGVAFLALRAPKPGAPATGAVAAGPLRIARVRSRTSRASARTSCGSSCSTRPARRSRAPRSSCAGRCPRWARCRR